MKHDAAQVMEFTRDNGSFHQWSRGTVRTQRRYILLLLKSSDLANGRLRPTRFVLLTQRKVGDPTDEIKITAPKTWHYLIDHADNSIGEVDRLREPRTFPSLVLVTTRFHPRRSPFWDFTRIFDFGLLGNGGGKPDHGR